MASRDGLPVLPLPGCGQGLKVFPGHFIFQQDSGADDFLSHGDEFDAFGVHPLVPAGKERGPTSGKGIKNFSPGQTVFCQQVRHQR